MKWNDARHIKEVNNIHMLGKTRTIRRFLLFPKCLCDYEWRWLEWANIDQEFCEVRMFDGGGCVVTGYRWEDVGWSDK